MRPASSIGVASVLVLTLAACSSGHGRANGGAASPTNPTTSSAATSSQAPSASGGGAGVPRWQHVVVVVEENKSYGRISGASDAPFINSLATRGTALTNSYAVAHPSEPNYLALFSGSTHGLSSDACPVNFSGPNLAAAMLAAGKTFVGYSDSLPASGYTGCSSGAYARKHSPWVDFPALPASVNQPFTAFPADFSRLPSLSFVIPNLDHDMHDGSVAAGDSWLSAHLGGYATWAATHDSLLIVTFDEDDTSAGNHIVTLFVGAHVPTRRYGARVDHYGVLRTVLAAFGLATFGQATNASPVTGIWSS